MKSLINKITNTNNGYEFGLALMTASVGVVFRDAGSLSADRLLQTQFAK